MFEKVLSETQGLDILVLAVAVIYAISRIVQSDWGNGVANGFRNLVSAILVVFSIALLVIFIAKISGCESNRNNPKVEQHNIPSGQSVMKGEAGMTNNQNDSAKHNVQSH